MMDVSTDETPPHSIFPLPILTDIDSNNDSEEDGANNKFFYCYCCISNIDKKEGYRLECGHIFCHDCLIGYLRSKIIDGQVLNIECFHPLNESIENRSCNDTFDEALDISNSKEGNTLQNHQNTSNISSGQQQMQHHLSQLHCKHCISANVIRSLLLSPEAASELSQLQSQSQLQLLEKFERFYFAKQFNDVRECPKCNFQQRHSDQNRDNNDTIPSAINFKSSLMECHLCKYTYCFEHGGAHENKTCEEYELSIEEEVKISTSFINNMSKPCPKCGIMIAKSGGCNHMRCTQCSTAFCWICGEEIDDSVFPKHFQWWTGSGCSNLQMNEAIDPSECVRRTARASAFLEILVLGPLSIITTIISLFLCCCCLPTFLQSENSIEERSLGQRVQNLLENCMSGWGMVWIFLLVILPIGLVLLSVGGVLGITFCILVAPFFAIYHISRGRYMCSSENVDCSGLFPQLRNAISERRSEYHLAVSGNTSSTAVSGNTPSTNNGKKNDIDKGNDVDGNSNSKEKKINDLENQIDVNEITVFEIGEEERKDNDYNDNVLITEIIIQGDESGGKEISRLQY